MQKQSRKQSWCDGATLQQAHLHVSLEPLCSMSALLSRHAGRVVLGELHLHIQQPAAQSVVPSHQLPPRLNGLQPASTRQQMYAPTLYKLCNVRGAVDGVHSLKLGLYTRMPLPRLQVLSAHAVEQPAVVLSKSMLCDTKIPHS